MECRCPIYIKETSAETFYIAKNKMVTYLLEGLSPCVYQSYLWEKSNISRQKSSKNSQ